MTSYRLTPNEYARYLIERDDLLDDLSYPADADNPRVRREMSTVEAGSRHGEYVTDGTSGGASYDVDGWVWVRTNRVIDWL